MGWNPLAHGLVFKTTMPIHMLHGLSKNFMETTITKHNASYIGQISTHIEHEHWKWDVLGRVISNVNYKPPIREKFLLQLQVQWGHY